MSRVAEYQRSLRGLYLQPGEVLMTDEPLLVTTTLGSCVAACMFDEQTGIAAICHGALPHAPLRLHDEPFRYVDEAVLYLVDRYDRLGVPASRLRIKIFGGGDVLGSPPRDGFDSIGQQNVFAAMESLGWLGVRPAVRHVGGERGRKLMFVTSTGEVFVKTLGRIGADKRERTA